MSQQIRHIALPELLARIRQNRAEFAALWDGLSDAQMTQRPGPQSDWSVKDLIAHVSFWERLMMENIERLLAGKMPRPTSDFDAINAEVFEANKDRTLSEVLAEFEAQLSKVEASLQHLNDNDINNPQRFPARSGSPLLNHIIGNTFGHYGDHYADLERYVASLKK